MPGEDVTVPRRINITVSDGVPLLAAVSAVHRAMEPGRISSFGKIYCYATRVDGLIVESLDQDKRRPNSDSFRVYKEKK